MAELAAIQTLKRKAEDLGIGLKGIVSKADLVKILASSEKRQKRENGVESKHKPTEDGRFSTHITPSEPGVDYPIEVLHVFEADTFYSRLDIPTDASEVLIRKAYRELAMRFNPERCTARGGALAYAMVNEAYETLIEPEKRKVYDQGREWTPFAPIPLESQIRAYAAKYGDAAAIRKYTSAVQRPETTRLPHFTSISQMPSPPGRRRRAGKGRQNARARRRLAAQAPVVFVSDQADHNENQCRYCRNPGELLLCDGCPFACHATCMNPPVDLDTLPDGDWFCPDCARARSGAGNATAANDGNTTSTNDGEGSGKGSHSGSSKAAPTETAVIPVAANVSLSRKEEKILIIGGSADDGHDDLCRECRQPGELILCDGCDYSGHDYCQNPPVVAEELPDEWYCARCAKK